MKRAVIYLRVSSASQANTDYDPEGFSIPAQRAACLRKAEALGATVVEEYVDKAESARSADRPALKRMLARIEAEHDVDLLIVHKVDRLARNRADDALIGIGLRASGCQLVSVSENIDETPSGMLMHGIMASIAEFFSQNLATEINKGLAEKARRGGTTSRAPIGYLNVRETVEGREIRTVAIDPDRAPLVRLAFECYGTGEWTLDSLLADLIGLGFTMPAWSTRPERPLSRTTLNNMLRNRYYAGIVTFKGVEYPGRHEPLISLDLFEQVQAVLMSKGQGKRQRVHEHYLKGFIYCGRCSSLISMMRVKGRAGGVYDYFYCLGRLHGNGCDQPYVAADRMEAAVTRFWQTITLDSDTSTIVRDALKARVRNQAEAGEEARAAAYKRITDLENKRRKLLQAYYADALPLELFQEEQAKISSEIAAAQRTLEAAVSSLEKVELLLDDAVGLLNDAYSLYANAPNHVRQVLNRVVWDKLTLVDEEITASQPSELYEPILAEAVVSAPRQAGYRRTRPTSWARNCEEYKNPIHFGRGSSNEVLVDALVRLSNPSPLFRRLVLTEPEVGPPTALLPQRHLQTHLTDDQRVELLERYMSGERAFELAKAFNLDRRTVAGILSRAGIRRPRSMTDDERAEAVRLYEQGWSCVRIGERLGRNHSTVWLALKAAGVGLRDAQGR